MPAQLENALAAAMLTDAERRVLRCLVEALQSRLGEDLRAIWLFGSRARGDAVLDETDFERYSDIDLIVVAEGGKSRYEEPVRTLRSNVVKAQGTIFALYPIYVFDPADVHRDREIEDFFIQQVDRDKIVLVGSSLDADGGDAQPSDRLPGPGRQAAAPFVRLRSKRFIDNARDDLYLARLGLQQAHTALAAAKSHGAMVFAARAALSEYDEHARYDNDLLELFRRRFVSTGAFEEQLYALARRAGEARDRYDEPEAPSSEQARRFIDAASAFIIAVEALPPPAGGVPGEAPDTAS